MFREVRKIAEAATNPFRVAKNYQKKREMDWDWHSLNTKHRGALMLGNAQQGERDTEDKAATNSKQVEDGDRMDLVPIDSASRPFFSPSAKAETADANFSVYIDDAKLAPKFE